MAKPSTYSINPYSKLVNARTAGTVHDVSSLAGASGLVLTVSCLDADGSSVFCRGAKIQLFDASAGNNAAMTCIVSPDGVASSVTGIGPVSAGDTPGFAGYTTAYLGTASGDGGRSAGVNELEFYHFKPFSTLVIDVTVLTQYATADPHLLITYWNETMVPATATNPNGYGTITWP